MKEATEFGKILRVLMDKHDLRQYQIAKEFDVAQATVSNYITGMSTPEMDFISKCVKRFDLKNKDLADFVYSAFSSVIETHQRIILDTRFIDPARMDMLIKFITVFVLSPANTKTQFGSDLFDCFKTRIDIFFESLEEQTDFRHVPYDAKPIIEERLELETGSNEEKVVRVPEVPMEPKDAKKKVDVEVEEKNDTEKPKEVRHISYEEFLKRLKKKYASQEASLPPETLKDLPEEDDVIDDLRVEVETYEATDFPYYETDDDCVY